MKSHGLKMVGEFINERVSTLPVFDVTRDPSRLVYAINDETLYIGLETEWSKVGAGAGFGEVKSTFNDGETLYPGNMYYVDTLTSPLSGLMAEGEENGNVITVVDISGSFATNTFTILGITGLDILNGENTFYCDTNNGIYTFFWDATYGWRINDGNLTGIEKNFKPSNLSLDDTDVGSDGGNLWGIVETVDFSNSQDGAVWGMFNISPEWNEVKDIKIKLGYSLNGEQDGTNVDLDFEYYAIKDGISFTEALSGSSSETITSSTSGATKNVGDWVEEELSTIKISSTNLSDTVKSIAFKFTRLGSTDTYSGTLQVTNIKLYQ